MQDNDRTQRNSDRPIGWKIRDHHLYKDYTGNAIQIFQQKILMCTNKSTHQQDWVRSPSSSLSTGSARTVWGAVVWASAWAARPATTCWSEASSSAWRAWTFWADTPGGTWSPSAPQGSAATARCQAPRRSLQRNGGKLSLWWIMGYLKNWFVILHRLLAQKSSYVGQKNIRPVGRIFFFIFFFYFGTSF